VNSRRLAFAALPVVAAAGVGGLGSRRAPSTYARLDKPAWAPPAAAFGPVWTALYGAVTVVGWRCYTASPRARREDRRAAALLTPYLAWCAFATALNAAVSEPVDVA
jgi:benzodiazapine receptor